MPPETELKRWLREDDGQTFVCTTDPACIDLVALNVALESDLLWWAKALPEDELKQMLENSLCLTILAEDGGHGNAESGGRPMIGFARIITDYMTFGYLTDVYILPQYQGKGLGRWMMKCLDEVISGWPRLRRFMILTGSSDAARLYEKTLDAKDIRESGSKLMYLERLGPGGLKGKPGT
ncbi:hypothetical protein GQ53DRAFT_241538 [Thozetella sp. PMI_491]|nr:hypothetical protein GQ53DRAFT_241538 [Thozetella sp. PMI_491]